MLDQNGFTIRRCERCGGVMMPKQSEIKLDKDRVIVEVAWICVKCGAVRGALIGGCDNFISGYMINVKLSV